MKGMIKKDLFMIKNNFKTFLLALFIYLFYSIIFKTDMSFFLPFMGFMISMTTFSYDDYNNWHTYAATLPQGRINIVKSKYITTILITVILTIVSIILSSIICSVRGNLNMEELLSTILGVFVGIIFMMSSIYPFLFKYGSEKGRLVMIILALLIVGVFLLFTNFVDVEISKKLLKFVEKYIIVLTITLSTIMATISYFISKKIYLNKEF